MKRKLGATGEFPRAGVSTGMTKARSRSRSVTISRKRRVIVDFGTPTVSIGMPPELASELAATLVKHGDAIDAATVKPELPS
jgi:hypothetical protein